MLSGEITLKNNHYYQMFNSNLTKGTHVVMFSIKLSKAILGEKTKLTIM